MAFCIPFAWLWLLPSDMRDFSQSLLATSLFSSNVLFWIESGYFDTAAELKPLLHTWSLAVEEQYYLIFPLLLILAWRLGKHAILACVAILFISSLAAAQWGSATHPTAAFFLLPTRAWELLIGSFISIHLSGPGIRKPDGWLKEAGGWFGLGLIFFSVAFYDKHTPFPGIHALAPTLGTALIIISATPLTAVGRILGHRLLVGIGLISYSAYLWHQPIFAFHKHSSFSESRTSDIVLITMTFLLAFLSWKYIESPFRNRKNFGRRRIFQLSGAGIGCFCMIGLAGHFSNGFEHRSHLKAFQDLEHDESMLGTLQCADSLTRGNSRLSYCYGSAQSPNALVVGDSHAADKLLGIESAMPEYRWGIVGNHSCPPLHETRFRSPDGIDCTERLAKIFEYIDGQKSLDLVVLAFAQVYPLADFHAADHLRMGLDPQDTVIESFTKPELDKSDAFFFGLKNTIRFLEDRNIAVVILLDVPELSFFPIDCLKGKSICHFDRADALRRQQILRKHIAEITTGHDRVAVFDPLDLFCDGNFCQIRRNGRIMYRDSHHLTRFGSREYGLMFANWYAASRDPRGSD